MARKLRMEYPGAIYHVMNRGDRREPIFKDDEDRQRFLTALGQACGKTGWQIHALCLMPNQEKLKLAVRLRAETSVTVKWIAERLRMGTWTHLNHLLYWQRRETTR
jgi:REP element-mobilizing transposase RayT